MMNWIWLGFILISVLVGALNDQMDVVTLQIFDSCKTAVQIAINLIGVMAFFLGLMKVAEHAGLMLVIAKILKRPMKLLFPEIPENHPAMSAMILNFAANMLGLANAATPFGIKAMIELNKLNQTQGYGVGCDVFVFGHQYFESYAIGDRDHGRPSRVGIDRSRLYLDSVLDVVFLRDCGRYYDRQIVQTPRVMEITQGFIASVRKIVARRAGASCRNRVAQDA